MIFNPTKLVIKLIKGVILIIKNKTDEELNKISFYIFSRSR
ncbi:hypothetical protein BMS3Abin03_02977 [bacterium BMS3Abin03]|nr:hypothetical protein BMS3Abin03_02977 [bacterium BMS3Abin03]